MTDDQPLGVDISRLPWRIKDAIERYICVVDMLHDRVRQVALAAMARDPTIDAVGVSVAGGSSESLLVSRVLLDGIADPDLHGIVERRVMLALRELGWREARLSKDNTWTWRLIDVRREDASAHEMAAAARLVRL
jgi:hypothetical protein